MVVHLVRMSRASSNLFRGFVAPELEATLFHICKTRVRGIGSDRVKLRAMESARATVRATGSAPLLYFGSLSSIQLSLSVTDCLAG